jgi:hypothetical protein
MVAPSRSGASVQSSLAATAGRHHAPFGSFARPCPDRAVRTLRVRVRGDDGVVSADCMSINTVKTYIRTAYRRIGVDSRTRAVLRGVDLGFRPVSVRPRT